METVSLKFDGKLKILVILDMVPLVSGFAESEIFSYHIIFLPFFFTLFS